MRQTHHWAADVFVVAIVLHLLRVFFTGAYRKPRELTYSIGVTMLCSPCSRDTSATRSSTTCSRGWGSRSATGWRCRCRSSARTSPRCIWGGPVPRQRTSSGRGCTSRTSSCSRSLIGEAARPAPAARRAAASHPVPRRARGPSARRRRAGVPRPGAAIARAALAVAGGALLLGGLVQINPIWLWGPYHVGRRRTARNRTGTSAG